MGCDWGTPDTEPVPIDPVTFPELHLTETKNMLPLEHLTNGAKAIFVNQFGEEKVFVFEVEQGIHQQGVTWSNHWYTYTEHYQAEYFKMAYVDSAILNRTPWIGLGTQYGQTGKSLEALTAGLAGGTYFPIISIESTGRIRFGDEVGSYDLNGHNYQNVYTNWDHQQVPAPYSRLYYNFTQGIVAFEGFQGQMWAFDRFEN